MTSKASLGFAKVGSQAWGKKKKGGGREEKGGKEGERECVCVLELVREKPERRLIRLERLRRAPVADLMVLLQALPARNLMGGVISRN